MILYGADGYSVGGGWYAYMDREQCVTAAKTFSKETGQESESCVLYREDVYVNGQALMAAGKFGRNP